jgi:hypothetical protein
LEGALSPESKFSVAFPNSSSLRLFKNATGLSLPRSKINIVIADSSDDPQSTGSLSEIWMRLFGTPLLLRTEAWLLAALVVLGKPLRVDDYSIANGDTILVKLQTHVPSKLKHGIPSVHQWRKFPDPCGG